MPTENYGYIIKVPEENGYDVKSFRERVEPHLRQLGVEAFSPAIFASQFGINEDEYTKCSERNFGLQLTIKGEWYDEIYRKAVISENIIREHYGLEIVHARIIFGQEITWTFQEYPNKKERE